MSFSDSAILPIPNSVFYLTGVSVLTLIYVSYAKAISKIPGAVGEQVSSVSTSVSDLGTSIKDNATALYNKVASPSTTIANTPTIDAPAQQPGLMNSITNTMSKLNPFQNASPPTQAGGSKKKNKKTTKKSRSRRRI
jgi:hypothetical protein